MTNTANVVEIVSEAVSCIAFSKDMRKSAATTRKQRQLNAAQDADRAALEYIRQAQQRLDAMVAEINANS